MDKEYKYELHLHTSEVSGCAEIGAEEACRMYMAAGYSGMVVTDHFHHPSLQWIGSTYDEISRNYVNGYLKAKETAAGTDFVVLLGMEFRFNEDPNDYLIYGLSPEMIANERDLDMYDRKQLREFADRNGLVIIQAHPFRSHCIADETPGFLDGVEVYNGHPGHASHNELALEFWQNKIGGIKTSGSDFHAGAMFARGGIITNRPIKTEKELVDLLKSGDYKLLRAE